MRLPLLVLAAIPFTGCVFYDDHDPPPPPRDPYGDLAFEWSFGGLSTCTEAQVDEVDVAVFQNGSLVLDLQGEPCVGGGLIFPDMYEGFYEVFIDAYSRDNFLLYAGSFDINVIGERVNDAGVVVLDPVNAPPPPVETGNLALFWSFAYPTDNSAEILCDIAGAREIDVVIEPLGTGGAEFFQTMDCDAEGIEVSNLPEGRYELSLVGYGLYHDDDIMLYDSGALVVEVFADSVTDLGDVVLGRVDESFADFDVAWSFVAESCASAGLSTVTVSFQRFGHDLPEDSVTVDCNAANLVRPTFVPGSYDVSAAGIGSGNVTWLGTTIVDLPPDSVAEVNLVLAPAG